MVDKCREIILKVLYDVDKNGAFSNIALDKVLNQARKSSVSLDKRDVGFISEIVYGTVSWRLTLDEIIKKYSNVKIKKISLWILNILRMSIYQIVFLDKVPKSAAVNEAVNLAKRYGHKSSSNFVNAILRKIDKKDYEEFFKIDDDIERISKTTSMPMWIVEELLKQYNIEEVESVCRNSNMRPKLYIRVNRLKTNKQDLINELIKENIIFEETDCEDFLELKEVRNIENIQAFKQGLFTVQDKQAGKIPLVLDPKPNQRVLDSCSSPGGKTSYIAEIMENKGEIIAWDIHLHRAKLVEETAKRLGIDIIKTEVRDATIYEEKYVNFFDKILLDVPCLGLGVLKRKPDIKWRRNFEDINEITKVQSKILENCSKYLKVGGEIVYSTCSILKDENEKIIENFVEKNKMFVVEETFSNFQNDEVDGFYICKLLKKR